MSKKATKEKGNTGGGSVSRWLYGMNEGYLSFAALGVWASILLGSGGLPALALHLSYA